MKTAKENNNGKQDRTRRQHWLPLAAHLQNFTVEGKVQVYQFTNNDKVEFAKTAKQFSTNPINVSVKNDMYEAPGLPVNLIEDGLAQIENAFNAILEEKIKKHKPLSKLDHDKIAYFASSLEFRSLAQNNHLQRTMDKLEEKGRIMALANNSPRAAKEWSKEVSAAREVIFSQAISVALDVNKWQYLDYCFLSPQPLVDIEFITSDHPVSLVDFTADNSFYGKNHWNKTAECIVPLTPDIVLFGNNCGIKGFKEIDYNFVREINYRVLSRAEKMIISRRKISEDENRAIVRREPQSILLHFMNLPKGNIDLVLEKLRKEDRQSKQ